LQTFKFARGKAKNGGKTIWNLPMPSECRNFKSQKGGLLGKYLRAVSVGMYDPNTSCGAEVTGVAVQGDSSSPTTTAVLRVNIVHAGKSTTTYTRFVANQTNGALVSTEELAADGQGFYKALLQQSKRWNAWVVGGAAASLPSSDRRYIDQTWALLTAYLNLDRGLVQEYGLGKFANEYNEYLPLDTLALNGALLEWGQHVTARRYLEYFFRNMVNATTGQIIYSLFGCDGDPDYGRLIRTYVQAVRYSGDTKWANELLPIVEKMAGVLLAKRALAETSFPKGNPLHGIVPGSPEHDICGGKAYFFSINVWYVRGLSDLDQMLKDYSLSYNKSLEAMLEPITDAWRQDIDYAANFTAVRNANGLGFLFAPLCRVRLHWFASHTSSEGWWGFHRLY